MSKALKVLFCISVGLFGLSACVAHHPHRHKTVSHGPAIKKVAVVSPSHNKVIHLPHTARVLRWKNRDWYFHEGRFYQPHLDGFILTTPPIGMTIQVLPPGFVKVKLNGQWFYHQHDVYLQWNSDKRHYVVVTP